MKNLFIKLKYKTNWGEVIKISGSTPQLGQWQNNKSIALSCIDADTWAVNVQVPKTLTSIDFNFSVYHGNNKVREEGETHSIIISQNSSELECIWKEKETQPYFKTSAFKDSIFKQESKEIKTDKKDSLTFLVSCHHVGRDQEIVITGDNVFLGSWDDKKAVSLSPSSNGDWFLIAPYSSIPQGTTYKFAIRDKTTLKIVEWEEGENRIYSSQQTSSSLIVEQKYHKQQINWKGSGVAIPIFSLRSENSYGIGEFSDLPLMIDWAVKCKMQFIQTLPINDTTATHSWLDSYPYNAISIYALHPIYLGLHQYPLKDKTKDKDFKQQAKALNSLSTVDYDKVIKLKTEYIKNLYQEIGAETLNAKACKDFISTNEKWLFPYACFCYLRNIHNTTKIREWGEFSHYNAEKMKALVKDQHVAENIKEIYFTQFLLHKQLSEATTYAHQQGVVLKGDIPIGVSPNSVEVWTDPQLFHLECQTGAPPDDFSINGQNWGFPTYNWAEMKKDNYQWWTNRFVKMSDYFDAYRIDHILGFFRIWEIPNNSVHGLLGYFSPALPLSKEEIQQWHVHFDPSMAQASIHQDDLDSLFKGNKQETIEEYLVKQGEFYTLKKEFDNQQKIKAHFNLQKEDKKLLLRDALYNLCNEVLFIQDKYQQDKYHPRISLNQTLRFARLNDDHKWHLQQLYENYFYFRHSSFWKEKALEKLPTLINATNMLVCGEDLGMVPASVPDTMEELDILSLEIQRMPKQLGVKFSNLQHLPYPSVCTTSTHDMSPIRMWWEENTMDTQEYYNHVLQMKHNAPKECNTLVAMKILETHLNSPAMLTILPLQDWLSISDKFRRKNADEERINIPANPQHYWNYRMHLTLEELNKGKDLADTIYTLNESSGR